MAGLPIAFSLLRLRHRYLRLSCHEQPKTSRIDLYHGPRSYAGFFSEQLKVNFPVFKKSKVKREIPDITAFEGRLFLSQKAYNALKDLIEFDGKFISAVYDGGEAFIFTLLNVAENIDALDTKLSRKNEWGDLENISFHEEKLGNWVLFRVEYNAFYTLQCTQVFIDAVRQNDLKGLYINTNLGSISAVERSEVSKLN